MQDALAPFGEHRARELQLRGIERTNRARHDGDDGEVAPRPREQPLSGHQHHVGPGLLDLGVAKDHQRHGREADEKQQHDDHHEHRAVPRHLARISGFFAEVQRDVPPQKTKTAVSAPVANSCGVNAVGDSQPRDSACAGCDPNLGRAAMITATRMPTSAVVMTTCR